MNLIPNPPEMPVLKKIVAGTVRVPGPAEE